MGDEFYPTQRSRFGSSAPWEGGAWEGEPAGMPPSTPPSILREAANTFAKRNELYGDNYKRFGSIMEALFPAGLPTEMGASDWNRLGLIVQCVSKLTRYTENFNCGGHSDSAHDLCVYAAMLQELTPQ